MHRQLLLTAALLASNSHFRIGPWLIVPIIILAAIIAIPVYIIKGRRKRRQHDAEAAPAGTSHR